MQKLVETLNEYVQSEARRQSFLLPIEDVFSISGRGTVVTSRVEEL